MARGKGLRAGLGGGAAIVALLAGMAAAQEAGQAGYTPLGRLVLSAGAEKVAIDTPQAVTVTTSDEPP